MIMMGPQFFVEDYFKGESFSHTPFSARQFTKKNANSTMKS